MKPTVPVQKPALCAAALFLVFAFPFASARAAEAAGVHNFHEVNDHVYRGAQPSTEGFKSLAKLGVKTIIDLRESGNRSRAEERAVEADGMRYVSVPMAGFGAPTVAQISEVLGLLQNAAAGPVFVHCRLGKDRTGVVVAVYRMVHDHWTNQNALQEAKSYGMSFLQFAKESYIQHFNAATPLVAASPTVRAPVAAAVPATQ